MDLEERVSGAKARVIAETEARRKELSGLALRIHANPELGFKEEKASAWLAGYLEENGFVVERGICDLPTAFRATYGRGRPVIAILAEYDALPEVGHGCGHNLIAAAGAGAGVAARAAASLFGGTVLVIGTPAEELGAGKAIMVDRGGFAGVDIAMMIHPQVADIAASDTRALQTLNVEFFGQESHAGACPEDGINALEALIQGFVAVNSLRQRLKNQGSVHGVITDGGKLANIVPGHAAAQFAVRADDSPSLEKIKHDVLACFLGAATASGARLEYTWGMRLDAVRSNLVLACLFAANMETLGRKMVVTPVRRSLASSDLGNVSQIIPAIQPLISVGVDGGLKGHSPEWAAVAASEGGIEAMIAGAKALAMTVVDLLAFPEKVDEARRELQGPPVAASSE